MLLFFLTTTQPLVLTLNGLMEAVCKKQVDFKSEQHGCSDVSIS